MKLCAKVGELQIAADKLDYMSWWLLVPFDRACCLPNSLPLFHALHTHALQPVQPPLTTHYLFVWRNLHSTVYRETVSLWFCQGLNSHHWPASRGLFGIGAGSGGVGRGWRIHLQHCSATPTAFNGGVSHDYLDGAELCKDNRTL